MSWIARLEQQLQIETGDGQRWTVSWKPSVIVQEYNFTLFDFPNVPGTFVRRREPRGRIFGVEFYFQGENHIEDSDAFLRASYDKRQWRILHPYQDEIRVQPLRLLLDQRGYNLTKITGRVMETIRGGLPQRAPSFEEEIAARKAEIDELTAQDFEAQTSNFQPDETTLYGENINVFESTSENIIQTEEEQISYRNAILSAQNALVNIIDDAETFAVRIQEAINFPGVVESNVTARVNNLVDTYNALFTSLGNRLGLSRNNKVYSTNLGATHLSGICVASITNRDYSTSGEVLSVIDTILDLFEQYLDDTDEFTTENQTELESFAPNPDVVRAVYEIVNFTMSNLLEIALDSQQEYRIITAADSNVILLTHRVYGLDDDDANIDRFIATNNIGLNKIFNIPKDTEVLYLI